MPNVRLTAWSFGDEMLTGPEWKDGRPTYYIFYSHGSSPTPWQFWIELAVIFVKILKHHFNTNMWEILVKHQIREKLFKVVTFSFFLRFPGATSRRMTSCLICQLPDTFSTVTK